MSGSATLFLTPELPLSHPFSSSSRHDYGVSQCLAFSAFWTLTAQTVKWPIALTHRLPLRTPWGSRQGAKKTEQILVQLPHLHRASAVNHEVLGIVWPRKARGERQSLRFRTPMLSCGCMTRRFQNHSQSQFAFCGRNPQPVILALGSTASNEIVWLGVVCVMVQTSINAPSVNALSRNTQKTNTSIIIISGGLVLLLKVDDARREEVVCPRRSTWGWTPSSLGGSFSGPWSLCVYHSCVDGTHVALSSKELGVILQRFAYLFP